MTKVKAITNDIIENGNTQRLLFKILIGAIITLSVAYAYLIGSITFNVLARKTLESTILTMGSKVSQLELTYMDSLNKIDKNYALSNGFVDTNHNLFASRDSNRVAIR